VPQPATTRKCLFCDSSADSREHVVAEWLSKRMRIRSHKFRPAILNSNFGVKAHRPMTPENFRTRQVCAACNNGWMSHLEGEFQRSVGFLVEPTWPNLADEMIGCLRQQADVLIRWMIKTALVFEKSVPKGNSPIVPEEIRAMAKNGLTTNDFFLALGKIEVPGFTAQLVKGFPVWNGGVYHNYQVHKDGFSFAVHLNFLAMRLVRCPDASVGVKTHVFTTDNRPVVPFWVVPKTAKYDCSVHHAFPTFNWFLDAIEIYTGQPRPPLQPSN
jgi:hypothetical protein